MKGVLLAAASVAALMIPGQAGAQASETASFSASSGIRNIRFASPPIEIGPGHYLPINNNRHNRHIHVDDNNVLASAGWGYGSGGYYDSGDYDANRSFSPDKWNDWWHERPERAFPRWMSRNKDCARRWYSGDTLTC